MRALGCAGHRGDGDAEVPRVPEEGAWGWSGCQGVAGLGVPRLLGVGGGSMRMTRALEISK